MLVLRYSLRLISFNNDGSITGLLFVQSKERMNPIKAVFAPPFAPAKQYAINRTLIRVSFLMAINGTRKRRSDDKYNQLT